MLETEELKKVFKGKTAVENVSLYLNKGESVGLLGPNGAGKSTTISMMSSLIKPTAGDVRLHGQSTIRHPEKIRRVLGVVPQEIALYEELSAYENLLFFGRIYGMSGKKLKEAIQDVLELVGLEDRQNETIKTYSTGMKRRINIAAALLHAPEMIIMDEPTVGIDPQSRTHILEMVRRLNEENGLTVLYTSHYMEEVERLCDRVYIMDHGKVIASGTNDELKNILSAEETIRMELDRPCPPFVRDLQNEEYIHQVIDSENRIKLIVSKGRKLLGHVFQRAEQHDAQIVSVNVQAPTLEDVFLHLTGRKLRD